MQTRQIVSKQPPKKRIKNFESVALGYSIAQATAEAKRCLQCKKPQCVKGCPVEIDIPGFITLIKQKKFKQAIAKIKEKNNLPAICGRVCPQEEQCEVKCILKKKGAPINIGALERFAADYELNTQFKKKSKSGVKNKKVAVVGSGPAGLTCAGDLAKLGYRVTIFESLHKPGGVLTYGIPEFRLPKKVVKHEVDYIKSLGVKIETNVLIGRTLTVDDLFNQGFQAIFIGVGAGLPMFLNVPEENLGRIYSANEFLTRVNLMKAYNFPEYDTPINIGRKVTVIGAGNVAFDSARVALRLGAKSVTIVYRRSEKEMPARIEEIENAREEGVKFQLLAAPLEFIGDKQGNVKAMKVIKMELGPPDESGRRRPIPIRGSEFIIDTDTVIMAIGQRPNPLLPKELPELTVDKYGVVIADSETGKTSMTAVFAGGDITTGAATVISAMGAGKRVARAIDKHLREKKA